MDQQTSGLIILAMIVVVMGGTGLYALLPDIKRKMKRPRHKHI
ncbi:hypothetical protein [Stutzerimonas kunmingensis]|jgi:2-phospho-L-lactate transferase/gluconeogenesis factor (CofD/UPF0052 family)|nr:hypothetical protein [Stutzerimonas kunmingensis]